jgi:hypothetical protein
VKKIVVAVAGAALILGSVAACSAGPSAPPTAVLTAAPHAQVNNRTYTKADLQRILDAVDTTLKLTNGTAITDGPKAATTSALSSAVGDSPTISPASCSRFTSFNGQLVDFLGSTGVIVGTTSGPQLNLILATIGGGALPATLKTTFAAGQSALLNKCKDVTITSTGDGQSVYATIDSTPLHAVTNATQSFGFNETDRIVSGGGGSTSTSTWIEATDGNLLIFATSVTDPNQAGLEKAVNATVAAARS